jgi:hypothetical protein
LLSTVHNAFASGVDVMLWVCAAIAITAAVLAVLFLPRQTAAAAHVDAGTAGTPAADGGIQDAQQQDSQDQAALGSTGQN